MDVSLILNTIRANSSALYQERVPEATKTNMQKVGNAILEYESTTNEFLNGLVKRIAFIEVSNRRFKNPLAVLKTAGRPFGTTFEEIYVNPVKAQTFDGGENGASQMLKVTKPDLKTIFHEKNREDKYPVSVTEVQLQDAFTSEGEFNEFYASIMTAMYSGDEIDEYLLMRNLVSDGIAKNKIKSLEIDYTGDEESSKGLIKLLKTISTDMTFPSGAFNGYNVLNASQIEAGTVTAVRTWTPKENQILLIRSDVDANTDVEVLAKAFNMDKADLLKNKIVVDSFGDENTLCYLCDERSFKAKDTLYKVRSFDNGSNLVTNYWLHHHQILSMSLFANGVAIKKKAV